MNTLKRIITEHTDYRRQLFKLAKSELIKTYKGASLGWAWAIIRPAIQIFVYWFAFTVGLRSGKPVEGYPFFLWLIAGSVPWFYMRDMLQGGSTCLRRHAYLVTKIKYPISTIPTFVNLSVLAIHVLLVAVVIVIYMGMGFMPDIYYLQLPVYMFAMFMFFNAWALFAGLLSAMSRDFQNLVKSVTTALFWVSGILYDAHNVENLWLRKALMFNPITLIVNGYRNCFVYKQWFWETPVEVRNMIIVYCVMALLALWAYRKLYREVPDVL